MLALGAVKPRKVELGLVSATHGDLRARVASGRVAAQEWLDRFHGAWGGKVESVFAEAAF